MIEKWINELKKKLGKQKMVEHEMNENIFDEHLFEYGQFARKFEEKWQKEDEENE